MCDTSKELYEVLSLVQTSGGTDFVLLLFFHQYLLKQTFPLKLPDQKPKCYSKLSRVALMMPRFSTYG